MILKPLSIIKSSIFTNGGSFWYDRVLVAEIHADLAKVSARHKVVADVVACK